MLSGIVKSSADIVFSQVVSGDETIVDDPQLQLFKPECSSSGKCSGTCSSFLLSFPLKAIIGSRVFLTRVNIYFGCFLFISPTTFRASELLMFLGPRMLHFLYIDFFLSISPSTCEFSWALEHRLWMLIAHFLGLLILDCFFRAVGFGGISLVCSFGDDNNKKSSIIVRFPSCQLHINTSEEMTIIVC